MATTKFEVGAYYITMADKFGDGEQTGKSVVIERTEGTVTFKHLASGEIFVREVDVYDMADIEHCDAYNKMEEFIANNFGEKITTADIETVEPTAEVEPVENTAEVEPAESAVETTDSAAEVDKPTVEVCKAYDAKDIIAAFYSVEGQTNANKKFYVLGYHLFEDRNVSVQVYNKCFDDFGDAVNCAKKFIKDSDDKLNEFEAEDFDVYVTDQNTYRDIEDFTGTKFYYESVGYWEDKANGNYEYCKDARVLGDDEIYDIDQFGISMAQENLLYELAQKLGAKSEINFLYIEPYKTAEIETAPEDTAEIKAVNYIIDCTRQDILSYKKEIIYSESVIERDEKLIQLYAEENKFRNEDKSLNWLIELNQDEIESHESNIADYTRRIKREEARLADLEEKLAALKTGKVAA